MASKKQKIKMKILVNRYLEDKGESNEETIYENFEEIKSIFGFKNCFESIKNGRKKLFVHFQNELLIYYGE